MTMVYDILKSFIDPIFIIFVLLLISFFICLRNSKNKGGALVLLLTIILLYGFSIEPVAKFFSYKLERQYIALPQSEKKPLDVVVVLGGGDHYFQAIDKTYPNAATVVRVVHAIKMLNAGQAKYLVCSGRGPGKVSVAQLMAQLAFELGVPKEKIRLEAKSDNTFEHAVELNKMFADKSIRIGLVTEAYHMKRSEAEFRKYFKNVTPLASVGLYSSPSEKVVLRFIPQSKRLYDNTIVLREYAGRLWYWVKDLIS